MAWPCSFYGVTPIFWVNIGMDITLVALLASGMIARWKGPWANIRQCWLPETHDLDLTPEMERRRKALRFIIDIIKILAALPWDAIPVAIAFSKSDQCQPMSVDLFMAGSILRLLHFLPAMDFLIAFLDFSLPNVAAAVTRLGKVLILMLSLVHLSACLFWTVSAAQIGNSWVHKKVKLLSASGGDLFSQYMTSIVSTQKAMMFEPRGDLTTVAELLYSCLETLIAVNVYCSMFAVIYSYAKQALRAEAEHDLEMEFLHRFDQVETYLKRYRIPEHVQREVKSYISWLFFRTAGIDEKRIFSDLPKFLQQEISYALYLDLIGEIPLFKNLGPEAPKLAVRSIASVPILKGMTIFNEGDEGDSMYIIRSGAVEISKGGVVLRVLGPGNYFGEVAVLAGGVRSSTARALTDGEVCTFTQTNFETLILTINLNSRNAALANPRQHSTAVQKSKSKSKLFSRIRNSDSNKFNPLLETSDTNVQSVKSGNLLSVAASGLKMLSKSKSIFSFEAIPKITLDEAQPESRSISVVRKSRELLHKFQDRGARLSVDVQRTFRSSSVVAPGGNQLTRRNDAGSMQNVTQLGAAHAPSTYSIYYATARGNSIRSGAENDFVPSGVPQITINSEARQLSRESRASFDFGRGNELARAVSVVSPRERRKSVASIVITHETEPSISSNANTRQRRKSIAVTETRSELLPRTSSILSTHKRRGSVTAATEWNPSMAVERSASNSSFIQRFDFGATTRSSDDGDKNSTNRRRRQSSVISRSGEGVPCQGSTVSRQNSVSSRYGEGFIRQSSVSSRYGEGLIRQNSTSNRGDLVRQNSTSRRWDQNNTEHPFTMGRPQFDPFTVQPVHRSGSVAVDAGDGVASLNRTSSVMSPHLRQRSFTTEDGHALVRTISSSSKDRRKSFDFGSGLLSVDSVPTSRRSSEGQKKLLSASSIFRRRSEDGKPNMGGSRRNSMDFSRGGQEGVWSMFVDSSIFYAGGSYTQRPSSPAPQGGKPKNQKSPSNSNKDSLNDIVLRPSSPGITVKVIAEED
ncbi:hypothetical protein BJ742DRAFT_775601 [Cladochytrium replicatum]|nr:hypothetical protein BJ742DRAFT_775601 [Cladochytrium replicatum]